MISSTTHMEFLVLEWFLLLWWSFLEHYCTFSCLRIISSILFSKFSNRLIVNGLSNLLFWLSSIFLLISFSTVSFTCFNKTTLRSISLTYASTLRPLLPRTAFLFMVLNLVTLNIFLIVWFVYYYFDFCDLYL